MSNPFDANTVQSYGGVAWAKQQMDVIKSTPSAIDDQISGYQNVNASLNQIVSTLNTSNSSLQSAWSGSAASTATQSFTEVSNHAQNVTSVVEDTITQLNAAKATAQAAVTAMSQVPNEKPVPKGNVVSNAWDELTSGTTPAQQAEQFNAAARAQAADVLNTFSSGYNNAANNMNSLAASRSDTGFNTGGGGSGAITLPGGGYGGVTNPGSAYVGSTGASKGGTNEYHNPGTTLAGDPPVAKPAPKGSKSGTVDEEDPGAGGVVTDPIAEDGSTPGTEPPEDGAEPGDGLGTGSGLGADGELPGEGGVSGGALGEGGEGGSALGSSNVFGEDGFGASGFGAGGAGGTAGAGGLSSGLGDGVPIGGASSAVGADASAAGHATGTGLQPGLGGTRGGAGGLEDEQLGPVKYSRGRFFEGDEPGSGSPEWVPPAVGGDESLLIRRGARTGDGTRVASAYEGATDADGKPLGRMGLGGRAGIAEDEEEERGERPGYLKEDPEWWQSKQAVAPPTVK